jgi:glycosyltransferase involved in cell wall biosynthesis
VVEVADRSPTISVIVIFFNEAHFLAEAIDSVIGQTFDDWELILVDDGSTDSSQSIAADAVRRRSAKVRFVQHRGGANRGMSASRNLGIDHARGEWLTFLDGDDVWDHDKLEVQLLLLGQHRHINVLASPALWWYEWAGSGEGPGSEDFVQTLPAGADSIVDGAELVAAFLRDEWSSLCDVVARRSTVIGVGGYEERFVGMFEDQVFHSKLCLNERVLVTDRAWYRYRQHAATSTYQAHAAGRHFRDRRVFLGWLREYLQQHEPANRRLRAEVNRLYLPLRFPILRLPKRILGVIGRRVRVG